MRYPGFLMGTMLAIGIVSATQEHSDPEGLYSHQLAHIFFIFSMLVLAVQIKRNSPPQRGWTYIFWAAVLFLLWNIDTFAVHTVREGLTEEVFLGKGWDGRVDITTAMAKSFYAGKVLDHVLSVSAALVFLMGIRSFQQEAGE